MESFKLETKDERVKRKKTSMWSWKISDEDLKNQVDNYSKLKITESYRGISVLLGLFSIALTLIFMYLGWVDSAAIYDVIILVPILFFVYKGHRWAIIALIAWWTIEKGYQLYLIGNGSISVSPVLPILWWLIYMPYFWKALRVENAIKSNKADTKNTQPNKIFCHTCGSPIETDAKFCTKCGNKV